LDDFHKCRLFSTGKVLSVYNGFLIIPLAKRIYTESSYISLHFYLEVAMP